jgi:hypothetical protein
MKQKETANPEEILSALLKIVHQRIQESAGALVIGIDGMPGAGKTTLSTQITCQIPAKTISTDEYLDKHKGYYSSNISYTNLKDAFNNFVDQNVPVIVFEGVCLLKILDCIDIQPDILIYIKHLDSEGIWKDYRICDSEVSLDEAITSINRAENIPGIGNFDKELAEYHRAYTPIEKSKFILYQAEI